MTDKSIVVVGAGIAGLTAGALLAHEGLDVTLLEAHVQPGGCAGTFRRGPYIFDAGATQVAGLEPGGIHERIFRHLKSPLPIAEILDPACLVHLGDGKKPIHLWYDSEKWKIERKEQFPGSESFWSLCSQLHQANWSFAGGDPVVPVQNFWDLKQFLNACGLMNFSSALFSRSSVADLLWFSSCTADQRLRKFLDLQLKLYSQETAEQTAALYGATVLQMAQEPLGLWHLKGSMQKLSDHLLSCFLRDGGTVLFKHKVVSLVARTKTDPWRLDVVTPNAIPKTFHASDVIFTLPPQCLLKMMTYQAGMPKKYRYKLEKISQPSGAIVFYGAINRSELPLYNSGHIQIMSKHFGSVFISISFDGDGRAPVGEATLVASAFADVLYWSSLKKDDYQKYKYLSLKYFLEVLQNELGIESQHWIHKELATPKSFARWTGRPKGIVGGIGQTPSSFGPFGLSSRTPLEGLWLCGDSIYPGEGTAGVSQSALMACRQLMSEYDTEFNLTK